MTRRALSEREASAVVSWLWSSALRAVASAEGTDWAANVGAAGWERVSRSLRRACRRCERALFRAQFFTMVGRPGFEGCPLPEPGESVEGAHEGFLNGVFGVGGPGEQDGGAVRGRAVAADEFTVGLLIAAGCGLDQVLLANGGGRPGAAVVYGQPRLARVHDAGVAAEPISHMAISLAPVSGPRTAWLRPGAGAETERSSHWWGI